jgi:hypothetical protein
VTIPRVRQKMKKETYLDEIATSEFCESGLRKPLIICIPHDI